MMKKQTLIAFILSGTSLVSCAALAESTTTSNTSTESTTTENPIAAPAPATEPAENPEVMSKTNWLNTIVPMLPSLICKGFMGDPDLKARLEKINMNYEQCVNVMPESVKKCQNQLSGTMPDKITNKDASIWGKNLGECIGKDFAMNYLISKQ